MERLFDLDLQLIHDAILLAVNVLILVTVASYCFFNPVRDMLKKRQEKVKSDIDFASKEKEDAAALKAEYDAKLNNVQKEAEEILSQARKKALANEAKIVEEAKAEAVRIIERANHEAELEKKRVMDDVKTEMISIASILAGKVVAASIDTQIQDSLIEETLKEIGDDTWLS